MKSMIRHFIAVTFGLCLFMLFSISSFASTGYPWFKVPNNARATKVRLVWYDSTPTKYQQDYTISSGNVAYITKPSNFDSTYSPNYDCRVTVWIQGTSSGYYGVTFENSNVKFIDNDPNSNYKPVCWASTGYGSNSKYSIQTTYINPTSQVYLGQTYIYHPNGDGGTHITSSDFPISFKINAYVGQFNYAGITDNASYDATTINSNKANTAIELTGQLSEDIEILSTEVSTLETDLASTGSHIIGELEWIARNLRYNRATLPIGATWTDSQGYSHEYSEYNKLTFTKQNEKVKITTTAYCGTFLGIISTRFRELIDYFQCLFDVLWEWWYPLKASTPQYWNVYNTDTDDTELVNPSTVTYYITWYLGQLFLMNNDNTPLGNLQDSVDDIKDQLVTVENQEQSIITSIRNGIDNFTPDLSQIGSFKALSWCSNYLQQIYVSLGTYGTVILIGLLLGVCMQFIGYFRYK